LHLSDYINVLFTESDIKDFVEKHSEYSLAPSLPSADPGGEPEPALKQAKETKPSEEEEEEEERGDPEERERRDSEVEESVPLPNGTAELEKVPPSLPAEKSAAKLPASKHAPEEPLNFSEEPTNGAMEHAIPTQDPENTITNESTDKYHNTTNSDKHKPLTQATKPDRSKRNSTKVTEPYTSTDDVPIVEVPTQTRRRAHTQPPAASGDDSEGETETTSHREDEKPSKKRESVKVENPPPIENHSLNSRKTKVTQPNKSTRTSSEYNTSVEPVTTETHSTPTNHTEQLNKNTQKEKPQPEKPESTVTITATTNRFNAGMFRTSNISSHIDRFNQSSYSTTTFKRDDFSYSTKPVSFPLLCYHFSL
jgi:hypothetical protein